MQTHALALANHLQSKGYPIRVLTYRANRHEEKNAARTFDVDLSFPVRRLLSRLGYWNNIRLIAQDCREFKPDLIYSSTVFYGFLSEELDVPVICRSVGNDVMRPWIAYPFRFGGRLLGSPLLEQPVYDLFKKFNYPEWVEVLFHRYRHQLMVRSARLMHLIMANSKFTSDLLSDIGIPTRRIELVVGGVDARRFLAPGKQVNRTELRNRLGLPPRRFIITTACRLVAKKGIDFLLNSFSELLERMPDAHLVIIGEGKHAKRYRRLANRLNLRERVTFTGRVPQNEIQHYYWASNLFALASRIQVNKVTGIRDAETMGRVLCEANAAGTPVLAANSGGIPSVIKNNFNGLLFEPGNTPGFIKQVLKIRNDKALKKKIVGNGKKLAREKFDWSKIVAAHERAIYNIVKTNHPEQDFVVPGKDKKERSPKKRSGAVRKKSKLKTSATRSTARGPRKKKKMTPAFT